MKPWRAAPGYRLLQRPVRRNLLLEALMAGDRPPGRGLQSLSVVTLPRRGALLAGGEEHPQPVAGEVA